MDNCAIIIFGATGDLTKKKLLPDLYRIVAKKKLSNFLVIGAAIDNTTIEKILEKTKPNIKNLDEEIWKNFKQNCYYQPLNFKQLNDFKQLSLLTTQLEKKHKLPGNRVLYCAAASHFFCDITENIAASGLAQKYPEKNPTWNRIVYEKPFGHNLESAHKINECIAEYFNESQIYRIDHYLTKELVGNIALIRFTNCVLEPLWNNRYVDNVQIVISEEIGIEGRGDYYDKYGALSDVVQNHMLELVALIAMESPEKLTGEYIRNERVKVLEKTHAIDGILGQYKDYKQEKNVIPDSTTETFASIMLRIKNPRWAGVPFYLKTGKHLKKKETVIYIKFKQVDCLLTSQCPSAANYLTIKIAPDAIFSLNLNVKKVGSLNEVVPVKMEFCHSCIFAETTPQDYEVLFEEVIRGEKSLSVRFDEIEYAWKIVDSLRAMKLPLYTYEKNSDGPKELEIFSKNHGMRWI